MRVCHTVCLCDVSALYVYVVCVYSLNNIIFMHIIHVHKIQYNTHNTHKIKITFYKEGNENTLFLLCSREMSFWSFFAELSLVSMCMGNAFS